ncbi:uncharacterized protein F5891DRAFT_1033840 [Suillus fuscotomentosus]|uniref:Uncharacterized protein n=1 Tax=Suillus fuscotomentosus TaxID=1912939 RepID=A0AAD4E8H9_9AGAM|nr:uncharacterized protein F5891DRAFT_1033840 [Suillus fuscotomentosus]KAG1900379.1 hypothetical protein F5891DRAFT_1033840 [Suillus fuscotomentosus]
MASWRPLSLLLWTQTKGWTAAILVIVFLNWSVFTRLELILLCTAFSLREYYSVFKRTAWDQSVIPTYLSMNALEMQSIPDGFQAWHEGRETFTGACQPDQAQMC